MYLSKLVGERTKENPADAQISSHILLVRAGFIKLMANGIWTLAMPAKTICRKIEAIIREEMNAVGGQEVSFPVAMPRELWEESGRYATIGEEMARFSDRNGRGLVLGMTHEEAAVHLARNWVTSYQQLPFMIYQFQTKFRDEARSRGGLIRVREFTMKDAYSFHSTQENLEDYYQEVYDAYCRIFKRIGMKNVVEVKSDTGMMGGSVAHEYMLLTPVGEDSIVLCDQCGYKANMEVAECKRVLPTEEDLSEPTEVFTGDKGEIKEIAALLNIPESKTIKAVSYNIKGSDELVVVFIRGDIEVNEAKLKKVLKKDIAPANLADSYELVAGNIGPIGLKIKGSVIFDSSLKGLSGMTVGANKKEYHITGVNVARDIAVKSFHDVAKVRSGDSCPVCAANLKVENGIEVGNIFQLGDKYSKSMGMTVLDSSGAQIHPIMGCYGIGIGRALASVAEESHDEFGLNWPVSIAPWHVYLCALRIDDANVAEKAQKLYASMLKEGIEVIFDDRDVSAGVKFSDCDLMGIPYRVVISPRSLATDSVEFQSRNKCLKANVKLEDVIKFISEQIKAAL